MATVKVVDIVTRAKTLLQDASSVRWPVLELQLWLNDSYRDIVAVRPDANTLVGTFSCAAGPRQVLTTEFATAQRLMDVVRNVATTSRKGAVRLASRQVLDDQLREWYTQTPSVDIQHYMFDPRLPKEFLVYPPATDAAELEVLYAAIPAPHTLSESELNNTSTAEVIRVDDGFAGAILDYVLYRAYSKDSEIAASASRAAGYLQLFQAQLGVKGQAEAASQPGVA